MKVNRFADRLTADINDYELSTEPAYIEAHGYVYTGKEKRTGKNVTVHMFTDLYWPILASDAVDYPTVEKIIALGKIDKEVAGNRMGVFYVIPAMKGHLEVLMKRRELSATVLSKCLYGTAKAIEHMHSKNITHCDLKTYSILVTDELKPLIANFELSPCPPITEIGGCLESGSRSDMNQPSGDVYSFGRLIYRMYGLLLYSEPPIPSYTGPGAPRWTRFENIPDFVWDLITSCSAQNPDQRPTFASIVKSLDENVELWAFEGTDILELMEYIATFP